MPKALNSTLDRTAEVFTDELQRAAIRGGWPDDVARKLKAGHVDGLIVPQYEGPQEDIENLEYGSEKEPPRPVLNNFFQNHRIKRKMQGETDKQMKDIVNFAQKLFS